jgi:hypothetical protein
MVDWFVVHNLRDDVDGRGRLNQILVYDGPYDDAGTAGAIARERTAIDYERERLDRHRGWTDVPDHNNVYRVLTREQINAAAAQGTYVVHWDGFTHRPGEGFP